MLRRYISTSFWFLHKTGHPCSSPHDVPHDHISTFTLIWVDLPKRPEKRLSLVWTAYADWNVFLSWLLERLHLWQHKEGKERDFSPWNQGGPKPGRAVTTLHITAFSIISLSLLVCWLPASLFPERDQASEFVHMRLCVSLMCAQMLQCCSSSLDSSVLSCILSSSQNLRRHAAHAVYMAPKHTHRHSLFIYVFSLSLSLFSSFLNQSVSVSQYQ